MLVRSQDNEKITDRIEFLIAEIPLNGEYGIYQPEHYRLFGRYSTMEKAIKALDMLEDAYGKKGALNMLPVETMIKSIEGLQLFGVGHEEAINSVTNGYIKAQIFQFPSEEEIPDEE